MPSDPRESLIQKLKDRLRRFLKRDREPPHDPYSYVTVPHRPRPGGRSAAAVVEEPDNY